MTDTLQLVHEFTRAHKTTITRDNGATEYVEVLPLLDQLQEAMTANRGTGGSGSLAKAPVSLNAVDLWQDITRTTAHALTAVPVHAQPATTLGQGIQQWAAWAVNTRNADDEAELNAYLVYWSGQIRAMFEPSVDLEAACPDCGEGFTWSHDGVEYVRRRALSYNQHRATCVVCGQVWEGAGAMMSLARAIHGDTPVEQCA
ncbi:MAG: hypothetical protein QJR09_08140 [Micrococcus sp.]|nr:hypothetical protein [Micrococcus sp.]